MSREKTLRGLFPPEPGLTLYGRLILEVFQGGRFIKRIDGDNIVVDQGKIHFLNLLGSLAGAGPIADMEGGDGGCGVTPPVANLYTPIAFTGTDTALRDTINIVSPVGVPTVDTPSKQITFEATLDSSATTIGDFNFTPYVLNELALRSSDGTVVALRSFESIPFAPASAVQVRATWILGVV